MICIRWYDADQRGLRSAGLAADAWKRAPITFAAGSRFTGAICARASMMPRWSPNICGRSWRTKPTRPRSTARPTGDVDRIADQHFVYRRRQVTAGAAVGHGTSFCERENSCRPGCGRAAFSAVRVPQLAPLTIIFQSVAVFPLPFASLRTMLPGSPRPRAADDFATIRARMEELRRERARAPADDDPRRTDSPRSYPISNRPGLSPAMRRALVKVTTA